MAKKSSTVHKGQVKLREKKLANGGSSLYLDTQEPENAMANSVANRMDKNRV